MNAADRDRVKALFLAAVECAPTERKAYLDAQCADDSGIRAEVERYLAEHDTHEADSFLDPLPVDAAAASFDTNGKDPRIGTKIGPYKIEQRIGAGGMGVVYRAARVDDFEQTVAIKIVKRGMDTDEVLRRFKNEMRFLAALGAHPAIAGLLDGGTTDDGLPYFIMEYVDGRDIQTYCDENRLTVSERLQLCHAVCDAIAFAHHHAVIHRDLKPSNILITPDGQPKLIDFGIAKLLAAEQEGDSTTHTRSGYRAMTPHYASPEQMRGEAISTATDVYSLGVVLYELLTGRRPYQLTGHSLAEIERVVLEQEPRKPSTVITSVNQDSSDSDASPESRPESIAAARRESPAHLKRLLTGDLDNIVLKALRKDPQDRYPSVGQFAADLARFLEGRPVHARPIGVAARGWRWLKRNPALGGMAAALVVLVVAATIVSSVAAVRFRTQRDELAVARNRTEREADTARRVTELLTNIYESTDPYAVAVDPAPGRLLAGRDAREIESLAARAEEAIAGLSGRPDEQSRLMHSVGIAYLQLAQWDNAERLLRRSLELRRKTSGPDSPEVAAGALYLARAYLARREYARAEPLLNEARHIFQRDDQASPLLGPTEFLLGQVAVANGQDREAINLYRSALSRIVEHLPADQDELRRLANSTADTLVLVNEADYDFKIIFTTEIPFLLEGLIHIVNYQGDEDRIATIELFRELLLQFVGENYEEASRLGREALPIARKIFGPRHANVAMLMALIGWAEYFSNRFAEAEPYLQESLGLAREVLGDEHPYVASIMAYLGSDYLWQGRLGEAEATLGEAVRIARKTATETYPELVAAALRQYGDVLQKNGKKVEAEQVYREAEEIWPRK